MENGIKIELTEEQINNIAEELDSGLIVYLKIDTKEIK